MGFAHTFSIVARCALSGELGIAVQSHRFAVGTLIPWAEAGVAVVANTVACRAKQHHGDLTKIAPRSAATSRASASSADAPARAAARASGPLPQPGSMWGRPNWEASCLKTECSVFTKADLQYSAINCDRMRKLAMGPELDNLPFYWCFRGFYVMRETALGPRSRKFESCRPDSLPRIEQWRSRTGEQ